MKAPELGWLVIAIVLALVFSSGFATGFYSRDASVVREQFWLVVESQEDVLAHSQEVLITLDSLCGAGVTVACTQ